MNSSSALETFKSGDYLPEIICQSRNLPIAIELFRNLPIAAPDLSQFLRMTKHYPNGFIFDVAGSSIFYADEKTMLYDF